MFRYNNKIDVGLAIASELGNGYNEISRIYEELCKLSPGESYMEVTRLTAEESEEYFHKLRQWALGEEDVSSL